LKQYVIHNAFRAQELRYPTDIQAITFLGKNRKRGAKRKIPDIRNWYICDGAVVKSILHCLLKAVALRLNQQYHLSPTLQTPRAFTSSAWRDVLQGIPQFLERFTHVEKKRWIVKAVSGKLCGRNRFRELGTHSEQRREEMRGLKRKPWAYLLLLALLFGMVFAAVPSQAAPPVPVRISLVI